jgi:hypothetical protein
MATQSLKDDGDKLTRRRDVEAAIKRMTFATVAAIQDLDRRVAALESLATEPTVAVIETDIPDGADGPIL